MMLNEYAECNKCSHKNPLYRSICEQCKYHLRDRVVNIDLWNTIYQLIEQPEEAFKQIIFSEHKNFITFLIFFISLKNLIIARFISVPSLGLDGVTTSVILSIILSLVLTSSMVIFFSFVQSKFYKKINIQLRIIDLAALNTYSFIPFIFGLFIIFPVELIVLGINIFSNNPYAFQIKPTISYILLGFELLMIIWSFFLLVKSVMVIKVKFLTTTIIVLSSFLIWLATIYIIAILVFTI